MLKTNSKKVIENVHTYITENFTPENYTDQEFTTFSEIANFIMDTFHAEKFTKEMRRYYNNDEKTAFADWCAGLPSLLDTCYYYNRSALDDLEKILEYTAEEKARYTEDQAEKRLTALIYREIKKASRAVTA